MGKFIILSFLALGVIFYEMSGGADFEPEFRAPVEVAQTDLAPTETVADAPEVTRADTTSLIQIAAPVAEEPVVNAVAQPAAFNAPLPAGEVIITPAPEAVVDEVVAEPAQDATEADMDLRAVAGDWVNMRSGPSTSYDVLETLPRGTEAEVIEVDADGWARIRVMTTGQEGWMAERLLSNI
jgi:hypothetical protein